MPDARAPRSTPDPHPLAPPPPPLELAQPGDVIPPVATASTAPAAPNLELDRLLLEIHVRIRQEQYAEVKERLERAKAMAPNHPAVLEIEGDLAFAQKRFKQAELLYQAAAKADPANARLEEKFATAVLRVYTPQFSINTIPDDADSLWSNRVARPPVASGILSAILPGLGQFYNGDWLKGAALIFVDLIAYSRLIYVIYAALAALGKQGGAAPTGELIQRALHSMSIPALLLLAAVWLYSVIDAVMVAMKMQPEHSR